MKQAEKIQPIEVDAAARLSGLTVDMIGYLERSKVSRPTARETGRGRRRRYTAADVTFLAVLRQMLARGIEVRRLQAPLVKAKAKMDALVGKTGSLDGFLVTDGKRVDVKPLGEGGLKPVDGVYLFAFVFDLERSYRAILGKWPTRNSTA